MKKGIGIVFLVFAICNLPTPTVGRRSSDNCYAAEKERGLIAYWSFDNEGEGVVEDGSGNGHDGKIQGSPAYEKGKVGNCLLFSGTPEDFVLVDHADDLSFVDAISIEMWIKISGKNGNYQNLICKWAPGARNYGLYLDIGSGSLTASSSFEGDPVEQQDYGSGFRLWDDKWHYVAMTFNGPKQTLKFYVDGKEKANKIDFSAMRTNETHITIGSGVPGCIDEVKLYSRALTPDEVKAHYEAAGAAK